MIEKAQNGVTIIVKDVDGISIDMKWKFITYIIRLWEMKKEVISQWYAKDAMIYLIQYAHKKEDVEVKRLGKTLDLMGT